MDTILFVKVLDSLIYWLYIGYMYSHFLLRLPSDLRQAAKKIAQKEKRSLTQQILMFIEEGIKRWSAK